MVKLLLEKQPDLINVRSKQGYSVLHQLFINSYNNDSMMEIAKYLLSKKPR